MLKVDEFVTGLGLKLEVQPDGKPPVTERLTSALNAPLLVTVTA